MSAVPTVCPNVCRAVFPLALLAAAPALLHAQDTGQGIGQGARDIGRTDAPAQAARSLSEVTVQAAESPALGRYAVPEEASVTRGHLTRREVPQTVEVVDAEAAAIYGADDVVGALDGSASVIIERNSLPGSRHTIRMRGFNASTNDVYVDGVRGTGPARYSTANVERIEVLKGPASILYGRSGGGGVINVVSKQAHFEQKQSLGLHYGAWAERSAAADINRVLSENWAFRLTAQAQRANSYRKRTHSKAEMLSPSLAWQSGNWRWVGQLTYDNLWSLPDRGLSFRHYEFAGLSPRMSIARPTDYSRDRMQSARSDLHWAINPQWDLRLQTTWRQMKPGWYHHYVGSFVGGTNYLVQQAFYTEHTTNRNLSNALTLNGEFRALGLAHKLTTALDWSRTRQFATGGSVPNPDRPRWNPPIDLRDPSTWVAAPGIYENFTVSYRDQTNIDNLAFLAQDLVEMLPGWKLMLGGRLERHKVDGIKYLEPGNNRFAFADTYFSPNMGLVWDISADHTAYASRSKSFLPPGGKGGRSLSLVDQYQKSPEHNRQTEIGLKSDWLDGALATQVAVYQLSRYNIPYRPDADNQPEVWTISGEERSRGLELAAVGQLSRHWQLRTSLGFMTAKVQKDENSPEREGRRLQGTSNAQGNLFIHHAPTPAFFAETGVTWTSRRHRLNTGARTAWTIDHLPGYAKVDAAIGWSGQNWRSTLAISNLLDKEYWSSTLALAEPRALRVRIYYDF